MIDKGPVFSPESLGNDLDDILNLMRVVGLDRKEDIVGFAARFYPEARTSGKLLLSIDTIWNEHERRRRQRDDGPPRYLGRSGPAR